jgi:hypothetical protein
MDVHCVSIYNIISVEMQGVSIFAASSLGVQVYLCPTSEEQMLQRQQYRNAGCILLHLHAMFLNAGMPDCTASSHRNMGTQSDTGMLRYWNEMLGAVILTAAALVSMPMPSFAFYPLEFSRFRFVPCVL